MNRAEKRRQQKLAKKAAKKAKSVQSANYSPDQQTLATQQALDHAVQLHTAGRLPEAETIYKQILQADPSQPVALHLLGVIAHQMGKNDIAVDLITKALAIKPDYAEAHNNLGGALQDLGKMDEAMASYHKALAIKPDYAEARYNLGNALKDLGRLDEAVSSYHKALAIKPGYAEAHNNLGGALQDLGKMGAAVASYQKALAINPDYIEAHNNLGVAFKNLGRLDEAVSSYHKVLAIAPDYAEAHNNLGNALQDMERLEDAVASYLKALAIKPDYAEAHNNLGGALQDLGKLDEAFASYQKALAIKPDDAGTHSNVLLAEQCRLGHKAETLYELHCDWDKRHGRMFRAAWPEHRNIPEPDRRLRIGFVSPDLGRHPVGYFAVRLFENLPENEIETVVYSDRLADDLTVRIKAATGVWRDVRGISDEDLTKTILADEIDILFDLSGHTAKNRLLTFARKPAPIQVSWAGYVGTTGLKAMDYLLSDAHYTPKNEDHFYQEKIIRMPDAYVCYAPPDETPGVGPLPMRGNGFVTFGSFNNPTKINDKIMEIWVNILEAVPNSRLFLKYKGIDSNANKERLTQFLTARGLDASRLILKDRSPHLDLLAQYNKIDIALDTFPYSGGLTTCEALWMGVPVITVPGKTFAGRHSLSHLSTVGLSELVAEDAENYVELAAELANDAPRLAHLRSGLRERMEQSPLCDGPRFSRNFIIAMQEIWREWCLR